jgi:hypothetical protein
VQNTAGIASPLALIRNQIRSTPAMCRTRPSSDSVDGGTARSLSCAVVNPEHFDARVSRWKSSQPSRALRSPAGGLPRYQGGGVRLTSGAVQADSTPRR